MSHVLHSPLGKAVAYETEYNPALLFPIARQGKRDEIGVTGKLPFMGMDIWNAYELSWLNLRGKPQVALATFLFPADSPNIVESKSFKLYLNSFNQTQFANIDTVRATLQRDLSACAGGPVQVTLYSLSDAPHEIARLPGTCIDDLDIAIDSYQFDPELLLHATSDVEVDEVLHSHLLESNCLVTSQPDWGSLVVHYRGKQIHHEALLRYLVSFRQHNEFHEQCVERIFMDLQDRKSVV